MPRSVLRRWLPEPETLRASRALRWLGPLLERPWLWQVNRRGIAAGVAVGLFVGLLLPLGQALVAGAAAVLLRANLPVAVLATFVSNPITTPLIVVGAYHVGAAALRGPAAAPTNMAQDLPWLEQLAAMGEPLLLGLLLVASGAALLSYWGVTLAWRLASLSRLARRRRVAVRRPAEERGAPR